VSWLKKNELDLKRHVAEIRDNIRQNWTMTGQEVGRELYKFWQSSRPGSPARMASYNEENGKAGASLKSPSALAHISERLEIPQNTAPGSDFATGYSLGLIGGVRSWVRLVLLPLEDIQKTNKDYADDKKPTNKP
jgi:choline-phosphate cytidylyltransferase